jgi:multidrug transporter EmrE-like cation transporter
MPPFLFLLGAALLYVLGGLAMKASQSLTLWQPSLLVYATFAGGATLQTLGMATGKMSLAYAVVLGLEAVLALVLAALFLGERISSAQLLGTALVVAGIVVLKVSEQAG